MTIFGDRGHRHPANIARHDEATFGARLSDAIAKHAGSWPFVIGQALLFALWVTVNTLAVFDALRFDPYPFFFFNLTMSAEAAFSTPIILMSQNRQSEHDRVKAEHDYLINAQALALLRRIATVQGVEEAEIAQILEAVTAE
jgi:uncharacterized membrane protein